MNQKNVAIFSIFLSLIVSTLFLTPSVFASCKTSSYGVKTCKKEEVKLDVAKRVSLVGSIDRSQKITNVKKGQEFIFYITARNESDKDLKNLKIVDNLPTEMVRVSGLDSSETFDLKKGKSKTFEIKAKIRDSEYLTKVQFEKCSVNEASLYYDGKERESGTATVCFGNGKVTTLPVTGPSDYWMFYSLAVISAGVIIKTRLSKINS